MRFPWSRKKEVEVKKQSMSEMARRDFFRRSVPIGIVSGVVTQKLLVKDLEPPKDPLVEELTRRVEEQEKLLMAQGYQLTAIRTSQPIYGSSCFPCSFTSLSTFHHNPNNTREM